MTYIRRKPSAGCYLGDDYQRTVHRWPCMCTEMDYECDLGYVRDSLKSNTCVKQIIYPDDSEKQAKYEQDMKEQLQVEQCAFQGGTYEVSQGYRKVPDNICSGGVQLSPTTYQCTSQISFFP